MNELMENRAESINTVLNYMGADFSVRYEQVPKNNVTLDALVMRPKENGVMSPTIYLNGELMEKTDAELASFLTEVYAQHHKDAPDMTAILTRERILDTVLPRLFSAENAERLDSRNQVYERMMDLLITYYLPVNDLVSPDGSTVATIQVTNAMLRQTGVAAEELKAAALKNMSGTVDIMRMSEMLTQLMGTSMPGCDDSLPMYVVTNKNRLFGAASILLDEVKDRLREILGDDYYILPSSIHEILAIPASAGRDAFEFLQMVTEINRDQVAIEDRLVDNVYMVHGREMSIAA